MSYPTFRESDSFEKRKQTSDFLRSKYPNSYPVIVKLDKDLNIPALKRTKFIVSGTCDFFKFWIGYARKEIKVDSNQAVFAFVKNVQISNMRKTTAEVYDEFKDEDGFLYITILRENTFG